MKAILVVLVLFAACLSGHAQGKVSFMTFNFAPVTNSATGTLVAAEPGWWAQLFYGRSGATDGELISMTNAPLQFAVDGYILGPIPSTPYYADPTIVQAHEFGTFQVRAWESVLGGNWEIAYANWLSSPPGPLLGKSNLGIITTADALGFPQETAASLYGGRPGELGIRGFALVPVPEPGVLPLGLAGALTLLWFPCRS